MEKHSRKRQTRSTSEWAVLGEKQEGSMWESLQIEKMGDMSESKPPFLLQQHFKCGGREKRRLGLEMRNK